MKGQGSRAKQMPKPAPPLLDHLKNAQEFRPRTVAEWGSCHDVLMSKSTKSGNNQPKNQPGLVLNNGESLQAPRSLEFGGILLWCFYLRTRIFIKGFVRSSVRPSVGLSVHRPVGPWWSSWKVGKSAFPPLSTRCKLIFLPMTLPFIDQTVSYCLDQNEKKRHVHNKLVGILINHHDPDSASHFFSSLSTVDKWNLYSVLGKYP